MTQADHEMPGMQISLADDLVDEQAQQSRCASNGHRFAGGSPPRSQPMLIRSGIAQMSRSAKKIANVRAKALGRSGALSQRKMDG
jgi:hypothetical protein